MPIASNNKLAPYSNWIALAEAIWTEGLPDSHALKRHMIPLTLIAENAQFKAAVIDYNEIDFYLEFKCDAFPDRRLCFRMSRLHGGGFIGRYGTDVYERIRISPNAVRSGFEWLYSGQDQKKGKAKRAGKK